MERNGSRVTLKVPHCGRAGGGLCAETQGRQIVAAMVNEAVERALGLAMSADEDRREQMQRRVAPGK